MRGQSAPAVVCSVCVCVCLWVVMLAAVRFAAPWVAVVPGGVVTRAAGVRGFPWGWVPHAFRSTRQVCLTIPCPFASWGFGPILRWLSRALTPVAARGGSTAVRVQQPLHLLCPQCCRQPRPAAPVPPLNRVLTREKFCLSRRAEACPGSSKSSWRCFVSCTESVLAVLALSLLSMGICEWSRPCGRRCTPAPWFDPARPAGSPALLPPPERVSGRLPGLRGST